jgi:hypothetical protein
MAVAAAEGGILLKQTFLHTQRHAAEFGFSRRRRRIASR